MRCIVRHQIKPKLFADLSAETLGSTTQRWLDHQNHLFDAKQVAL